MIRTQQILEAMNQINENLIIEEKPYVEHLPSKFIMMNQKTVDLLFYESMSIDTRNMNAFYYKGIPIIVNNLLADGQVILPKKKDEEQN